MSRYLLSMLLLHLVFMANGLMGQQDGVPNDLLTVAEKSEFKATSTSAEVESFLDAAVSLSPHLTKIEFGTTVEGRPMSAVICANPPFEMGQADERAVALVIANIHSGECAGKEAVLTLIRDLALNPDHPWFHNRVVVFAPNYNADGNDKMAKGNRPGQMGPEDGMGTRETSEGYDLNRDFIKLDTQEARAMVGLIDRLNPHMFIDCHTTNGSKHQYELTYDIPHNPSSAEPIRTMMREVMMPKITANLTARGIDTFYYGNFNRDNSKWTTYGFEPRYSTEYVGMRGKIAVLSEAYSYISYEERVRVSREFVVECIDYLGENAETIKKLVADVEADWIAKASTQPSSLQLHLQAELVPFDQPFQIMGYQNGQPHNYTVQFVGNYSPLVSRDVPHAYVFDKDMVRVAERLRAHGIQVRALSKSLITQAEDSQIVKINRSSRPFQKHLMTQLEVDVTVGDREFNQGDFVVLTAQPLGRLAGYILESSTNDGFVTWNHLDDYIQEGERYPISRIMSPVPADIMTPAGD